jgi:hypothetical protein
VVVTNRSFYFLVILLVTHHLKRDYFLATLKDSPILVLQVGQGTDSWWEVNNRSHFQLSAIYQSFLVPLPVAVVQSRVGLQTTFVRPTIGWETTDMEVVTDDSSWD